MPCTLWHSPHVPRATPRRAPANNPTHTATAAADGDPLAERRPPPSLILAHFKGVRRRTRLTDWFDAIISEYRFAAPWRLIL